MDKNTSSDCAEKLYLCNPTIYSRHDLSTNSEVGRQRAQQLLKLVRISKHQNGKRDRKLSFIAIQRSRRRYSTTPLTLAKEKSGVYTV